MDGHLTLGQQLIIDAKDKLTFDQAGPLYIVWGLGQVVDDDMHCQGWMSNSWIRGGTFGGGTWGMVSCGPQAPHHRHA